MTITEMQHSDLVTSIEVGRTPVILGSPNTSPRSSVAIPGLESLNRDPRAPRTTWKTKDDIRYYFRPLPREDIRVYFRPVSRVMTDRPRSIKPKVVPSAGKTKVQLRRTSPSGLSPSSPGPEVPPKAKARISGQKNRDIFITKQQLKRNSVPGQTNQNGSVALPGFNPVWTSDPTTASSTPLSPRITEVVDSSLIPSPLRNKLEVAAESAPEFDDRTENQKRLPGREIQPIPENQQSIVQEHQQTTLPFKPDSVYGTLPPLPIRLQRNNSQPAAQSPKVMRHRRQDTPYSPNDVGKSSAFNSPPLPTRAPSVSDVTGRTSAYASSECLSTPISLEEWASERRRIAHGQPAAPHITKAVNLDKAKEKDKTLKKTKSMETRFFRSRKLKGGKKEVKEIIDISASKPVTSQPTAAHQQPPLLATQDQYHPGNRWDVGSLAPSPEFVRPGLGATRSDMDNNPRSDSSNEKIVVAPPLVRASSDQSSIVTATTKARKPNKLLRMLEAYSKNVEGLQMVQ